MSHKPGAASIVFALDSSLKRLAVAHMRRSRYEGGRERKSSGPRRPFSPRYSPCAVQPLSDVHAPEKHRALQNLARLAVNEHEAAVDAVPLFELVVGQILQGLASPVDHVAELAFGD